MIARNSSASSGGGLVASGATVSISGSTIAENQGEFGGGMATSASTPGPITLLGSRVLNNISDGPGGGILNWGPNSKVTVNRSLIFGNTAQPDAYNAAGGGIATLSGDGEPTTTVVNNSTVSYNSSTLNGGGVVNHSIGGTATLRMTNSTVAHNEAADFGGGIDSFASGGRANVFLNAVTVAYNDANSNGDGVSQGGGLQHGDSAGTFSVDNSLIAQNTAIAGPDCAGYPFASVGTTSARRRQPAQGSRRAVTSSGRTHGSATLLRMAARPKRSPFSTEVRRSARAGRIRRTPISAGFCGTQAQTLAPTRIETRPRRQDGWPAERRALVQTAASRATPASAPGPQPTSSSAGRALLGRRAAVSASP